MRCFLVVVVAFLALASIAGPASAHATLETTTPAECRALLDEMDATAVSLSRTLRASNPAFIIRSTMYFTVDAADQFTAGIRSYRATGCADPRSNVPPDACRQNADLYRSPATELQVNLRGWDQYLKR